jgi:oligopeptide/dipeptide ABC transporter ATP-binding protein
MSPPLLEIRDLSVVIPTRDSVVAAVSGVSLGMRRGEILGVVGESGAGKTMLARAVTALLPAQAVPSGEVFFDGRDVLTMDETQLRHHRGAGAALCFQSPRRALSPFRRVGQQIDDRFEAHSRHGPRQSPVAMLESVGIRNAPRRANSYPHELSGGMAQRVMISLALACYPALLVADEPTTGLDVTLTRSILSLFRRAAEDDGRAVMVISHDVAAIAEICDRIAVMYGGMLVEEGSAAEVLTAPAHPYTAALLDAVPDVSSGPVRVLPGSMPQLREAPRRCPFAPRCPIVIDRCRVELPAPVAVGDGRTAACFRAGQAAGGAVAGPLDARRARSGGKGGTAVLAFEDVHVVHGSRFSRGGHTALRGVSLAVHAGETLGVVGESGCGKTTLARAALGLITPSRGRIRFEGQDLTGLSRRDVRRLRRRMQMVFQDPVDTLDPRRTVRRTLEDSLRAFRLERPERARRISAVLEQVGLDAVLADRHRHEISGGQAQRVGIARALLMDPDLVVFDEPTSALDVTVQAQILDLIEELMLAKRRAYVYVSHDLATVRSVSDRVAVLYLGTIVEQGPTHRIFERPLHPYTRALLGAAPSLRGTALPRTLELRRDLDDAQAASGCVLAPRCPFALDRCAADSQALVDYEPGHRAACWRIPEIS